MCEQVCLLYIFVFYKSLHKTHGCWHKFGQVLALYSLSYFLKINIIVRGPKYFHIFIILIMFDTDVSQVSGTRIV